MKKIFAITGGVVIVIFALVIGAILLKKFDVIPNQSPQESTENHAQSTSFSSIETESITVTDKADSANVDKATKAGIATFSNGVQLPIYSVHYDDPYEDGE